MDARWLYIAFSWSAYYELEPLLRGFDLDRRESLHSIEGAGEVLDDFDEDSPPEAIRNALLAELCVEGEGALFEQGLPELLRWLRHQPRGEDPAETLAGLITAQPGVEDWFRSDYGLVGILSADETSDLARVLGRFRRDYVPPPRPRGLAAIGRHFKTAEPAIEHLDELFAVVEEAAAEMLGLAGIRVD
jgi:hypothetical protein